MDSKPVGKSETKGPEEWLTLSKVTDRLLRDKKRRGRNVGSDICVSNGEAGADGLVSEEEPIHLCCQATIQWQIIRVELSGRFWNFL